MKFVALDFETANESLDSICQIGVASFDGGRLTDSWQTLVNPEDYFAGMNVVVHGIREADVAQAPKFPDVFERLSMLLDGQVVVHHTGFDKAALAQTIDKYDLVAISCNWLDTARVVRRTWRECEKCGYGLVPVAKMLGIEFKHHSAVEDARAAGEILVRAILQTGLSVADWIIRVTRPIHSANDSGSGRCTREGNPEGVLFGETVVFTGSLALVRSEAADLAAKAGCDVADSVTKGTTLLIVGDQDVRLLAGHEKSRKHRKAEELIAKGQPIRILTERDFVRMIGIEQHGAAEN